MGGIASNLGRSIGGDLIEGFGKFLGEEEGAKLFVRSSKAILNKTPVGKGWTEFLEKEFEPEVKKTAQIYLNQKINAGVVPHIAAQDAMKEAFHDTRKALIGKNDEALIKYIKTATQQGGAVHGNVAADVMSSYFHDSASYWRTRSVFKTPANPKGFKLTDVGIRGTPRYTAPSEMEGMLRRGLSWMYTPLIAIPHMGQFGNIILSEGITNVAKAVSEYSAAMAKNGTQSQVIKDIIRSGTLFDEIRFQILDDAAGGGIIRKLFHHPGFNTVRRIELSVAALAGRATLEDSLDKLAQNSTDKWARYNLERLGMSLQKAQSQGFKAIDEDIQKAYYTAANQSIFIRGHLETPPAWEQSFMSRMAFQYKHFGFRQGRFLAMNLNNAAKYGGAGQVAKNVVVLGTVFPIFGELIKSLDNVAALDSPWKRKDTSLGSEYLDALGAAGGLGIYYSMYRGGMWNYGKGYLEGPLLNTADDLLLGVGVHVGKGVKYSFANEPEKAARQYRAAGRTIASKGGVVGRIVAHKLLTEDKP